MPRSRLGGQHHRIRTINRRVGHIGHFCTSRHRAGDHRLHHLRRRDDGFVLKPRGANHAFLQCRDDRVADLDGEIAARHHDGVAGIENFIQRLDRFGALDLGDQHGFTTGFAHEISRVPHVRAGTRERYRQKIALQISRGLNVGDVFFRQRRRGQTTAFAVDAFVV